MKVRATRSGFYKSFFYEEGDVFEADKCPSWAEPADKSKPRQEKAEEKKPETLHEMTGKKPAEVVTSKRGKGNGNDAG